MMYVPVKAQESHSAPAPASSAFIPVSAQAHVQTQTQVKAAEVAADKECVASSGQNLNQAVTASPYIAPDLQRLVNEQAEKQASSSLQQGVRPEQRTESTPNETISGSDNFPIANSDDWKWLQDEITKRLKASEQFDLGLSFEQRGRLYSYRQELRNLPNRIGQSWVRDRIAWPELPNFSAI